MSKYMLKPYQRLVEKLGEQGAKDEMRRRRSLVKNPGLASSTLAKRKEISKMGNEARRANKDSRANAQQEESA